MRCGCHFHFFFTGSSTADDFIVIHKIFLREILQILAPSGHESVFENCKRYFQSPNTVWLYTSVLAMPELVCRVSRIPTSTAERIFSSSQSCNRFFFKAVQFFLNSLEHLLIRSRKARLGRDNK